MHHKSVFFSEFPQIIVFFQFFEKKSMRFATNFSKKCFISNSIVIFALRNYNPLFIMRTDQYISDTNTKDVYIQLGITIQTTASRLLHFTSSELKPFKLTFQQYNVLTILRGASPNGVSIKSICDKMIDCNSNGSRLVDKLVNKGLAIRKESVTDKRIVHVLITDAGLSLINEAITHLEIKFIERMQAIDHQEAKMLNLILEKLKKN